MEKGRLQMTNILDTVEPDKTETWPETIYLQREGVSEAYEDETTWCGEKINSDDVEYRRADVVERLLAEHRKQVLLEAADNMGQCVTARDAIDELRRMAEGDKE
jgi:hypothetical protein